MTVRARIEQSALVLAFVLGVAGVIVGGFAVGSNQRWQLVAVPVGLSGGALLALALSFGLPRTWKNVRVVIALGVTLLLGLVTGYAGQRTFSATLSREINQVQPVVERLTNVPDLVEFDANDYLRSGWVHRAKEGNGYVVRFGLGDGSVVEYASNHQAPQQRCTREIVSGWYRRFRCDD